MIMAAALAGAVASSYEIRAGNEGPATNDDVLYFQSSKNLRRFSLGYSSLLADIYWTRAVQYFGSKHLSHSRHYELLYPLLNIATDLDPELIVAYQNGAIFLSAAPPGGAGESDKAVALLEKGIRANPDYWRFYFTLGFIQYMDRKDYKAAQEAFERGSQSPGALPWMKVMAAMMAQHAGESEIAVAIWTRLYESTEDAGIRDTALQHLTALRVDAEVSRLQEIVDLFRQKSGKAPTGWIDLIRLRLLVGIPLDPAGNPYRLDPNGKVRVEDPQKFPFFTQH